MSTIYIDEKLIQETKMIAAMPPAGVVMLDNTLDDCRKVTNMCNGGPGCPVRRFSLFNNGRPGKPHWAGARENLVMTAQNGAFYNLRFRKDTRVLYKATRVGKCNLVTLEGGSKLTPKGQIRQLEKYTGELIEVLILFGDYLETFKTVWSLTKDMNNKAAFREFFSKVEDEDWLSLIGFLGTPAFTKSVPMLDRHDYSTVRQVWAKARLDTSNKGHRGETAFPPMRATEAQINIFLGLENDPIHLTKQFKEMREDAAKGGSLSLDGTLTMSDEDYKGLPQKRPFEREET